VHVTELTSSNLFAVGSVWQFVAIHVSPSMTAVNVPRRSLFVTLPYSCGY